MMRQRIVFEHATLGYGKSIVAEDLTMTIDEGAFVGFVGPSGAGKTTILRAILGAIAPLKGTVAVVGSGRDRSKVRLGYVPQLETIEWHFPITVRETILMGRTSASGPWPWPRKQDVRDAEDLMEQLGIGSLGFRPLHDLSGGQQQRVFLARALIGSPDLLLLDEPTSGVDVAARADIVDILKDLNDQGMTIVITTHDLNSVAAQIPEVICFNRTVIARGAPLETLTAETLRETFDIEMVVLEHDGLLITAEAPSHVAEHPHHFHIHHHHGDEHEEHGEER